MPLYISNSKKRIKHWLMVWLMVLTFCSILLICYEIFLKEKGFLPSVESNKDLWSWNRGNVYQDKSIVLLGASRSLLGINIESIKKVYPGFNVRQLSLNGRYPIGTLINLANDSKFNGNIIISIKAESINKVFFDMQKEWNDYYENDSTFYKSMDALIFGFIQSHFVFLNPSLEFKNIIENINNKGEFIKPDYVNGHLDLSISADYTKVNAGNIANHNASMSRGYWMKNDVPPIEDWIEALDLVKNTVQKIKANGGHVIFVRLPTDDELWEIDEEYFPRKLYWDKFMTLLETDAVHFKDVKGLDKFDLPDDSHLDFKDSEEFTTILFEDMKTKNLIK